MKHLVKNHNKEKLYKYLETLLEHPPTESEILEAEQSLYYFAKAKIEYLQQKKRIPHKK